MAQSDTNISNSEENVPQLCEILKANLITQVDDERKVKDLQAKLVIRDNAIKKYYVELNHLWEAVRCRSQQEPEHDDRAMSVHLIYALMKRISGAIISSLWWMKEMIFLDRQASLNNESDDRIDEEKCEKNLKKIHEKITVPLYCPLTEALKCDEQYASSPLSFADIQIKLCPGGSEMSFKKGSKLYFESYFPKKTTYLVRVGYHKLKNEATALCNDLNGRQHSHITDEDFDNYLKKKKEEEEEEEEEGEKIEEEEKEKSKPDKKIEKEIIEETLTKRRSIHAEEDVASCFDKWGKQNGKRMMIFTNLTIPHGTLYYPKDIVRRDGEFDVLVLCDEFILFCQVKGVNENSGNSNKRKKLKAAWEQSDRDLLRFGEATRDLPFISNLQMHTAIAAPNLNFEHLEALGVCKYHRRFILCKCDMEPSSQFVAWISNIIYPKNEETPKISEDDYKTLCARFVGMISKVQITTELEISLNTDEIVNPKNYLNNETRLYAILTPDQRQLLKTKTNLAIIRGKFGTGKSLILLAKALSLLDEKNKPMIISLSNIASGGYCYHNTKCEFLHRLNRSITSATEKKGLKVFHLRDLISDYHRLKPNDSGRDKEKTMVTPKLFLQILLSQKEKEKNVHFFFDEVHTSFVKECEDVFQKFVNDFPNSHMWLAIPSYPFNSKQSKSENYDAVIEKLIKNGYYDACLTRSLRIPKNVFKLVTFLQENVCPDRNQNECGIVIDGLMPYFFEVPKCTCGCTTINTLTCNCIEQRFFDTFKNVMTTLKLIESDPLFHESKCTILISSIIGSELAKPLFDLLRKSCDSLKIRLNINSLVAELAEVSQTPDYKGKSPNRIELGVFDQYTFMGCENALIIVIDPYRLFQCGKGMNIQDWMNLFTRSTSHHVHVYWPEDEATRMWLGDLDTYDKLTEKRQYLKGKYKWFRSLYTEAGRESTEDIVKILDENNLIIKMPVLKDEETICHYLQKWVLWFLVMTGGILIGGILYLFWPSSKFIS